MQLARLWKNLNSAGRGRALQRGSQATLLAVALLVILVCVNVLAGRFPQRFDLTKNGLHTLSPQTREVLAGLKGPVQVTAYVQAGTDTARQIEDLLQQYRAASPKVTTTVVDADKQPAQAKAAGVRLYDTVVVEDAGGQRQVIEPSNMFSLGADMTFSEFRGEQALTRALLKLQSKQSAVLYFLGGHGEVNLSQDASDLKSYLTGEGFTVRELNLAQGQVPADATLVVAAGPSKDLTPAEAGLLKNYVAGGGRLLLLFDPRGTRPALPHWAEVAAAVGVKVANDVAVDPPRSFFADPLTSLPELGEHEITGRLKENNLNVILPRAASLSAAGKDFTFTPLLVTTGQAWGETNFKAKLARDGADVPGPLTLAAAISRPSAPQGAGSGADTTDEQRVAVVVGSSSFITDATFGLQGNADFFTNAVNWLVGQDKLVTIRPKALGTSTIQLTASGARRLLYGTTLGLPAVILAAGATIWLRRRAL
jgi:hypothetical protein